MTTILQEAAAGRATIVPWTIEQYHRALENGVLTEDAAVELLDGVLVHKDRAKAGDDPMTIGDRHRVAVVRLSHVAPLFDSHACFLQTQQPISLPPINEPEPDGAVIRGSIDDYLDHPPDAKDVCCVIEVADSSLSVDLGPKARAYATAAIQQYIVADLVNDRVLVHEDPVGDSYTRITTLRRGETMQMLTATVRVSTAVDQLLP